MNYRLIVTCAAYFFITTGTFSQIPKEKHKKRVQALSKKKKSSSDTAKVVPKKSDYEKFFDKAETKKGLIDIIQKEGKYYFQLGDSLLSKDMLLGSRVVKTSAGTVVAGQMTKSPLHVYFSREGKQLFLRQVINYDVAEGSKGLQTILERNNLDPVIYGFTIKHFNKDSSAFIFDVTNLFLSSVKKLDPFYERRMTLFGKSKSIPIFKKDRSSITQTKAFSDNLTIKSLLSYEVGGKPYSAEVNRSLLLLNGAKEFKSRLEDFRVGYFSSGKNKYSTTADQLEHIEYINKWSIYPSKEDSAKYANGELVVPVKPIVFYVDTNFPEFWKSYLKEGILTWNTAFEAIGFKEAVQVKFYPKNDSLFDPENLTYTCVRYATSPIINAFGPSWTDPRTGEILQADVIFYHNIIKLIHNWKFVQTAQVNPAVRKKNLSEEEIGEAIFYIAAHEVGHTLGLPHNMAASHAFPVDSLRSVSFTQKYGTTPSIMDYARFNYVAQPEDKGVRLTPPDLGVYDKYAIKWGYKPLPSISMPKEEYDSLNAWIVAHDSDPMYRFGRQQSRSFVLDPTAQTEDLGDDVIKASAYGIKNIDYILDNLLTWKAEKNKDYSEIEETYKELLGQYSLYFGHLVGYLGGIEQNYAVLQNGNKKPYQFVDKAYQQRIVPFIFNEFDKQKRRWERDEITSNFSAGYKFISNYQAKVLNKLMNRFLFSKLILNEQHIPTTYTLKKHFQSLHKNVWKKTITNRSLDRYDRNLQHHYVKYLLKEAGYIKGGFFGLFGMTNPDQHVFCSHSNQLSKEESLPRVLSSFTESDQATLSKETVFSEIMKVKKLLKKAQYAGNSDTRNHYHYLLSEIERKMEGK
ncbi:MAG: zinc-dependent metalloprotease [Cyclobacteriaceae bacterium]